MKGIKLALVGVCLCLLGITMQHNANPVVVAPALVGVTLAVVGCFIKEK